MKKINYFFKDKVIPIVSLFIFVFISIFIWYWEVVGREQWNYGEVIVLNQDVHRGEIVHDSMLHRERVDKNNILEHGILQETEIIGQATKHFIPAGTQLHSFYFEDKELLTESNTFIAKIPSEWLLSVPHTLRRGDTAFLYEVSLEKIISYEEQFEDKFYKEEFEEEILDKTESLPNHSINQQKEIQAFVKDVPILKTIVAYTKDSANREVQTISEEERFDGSSRIADVEIITSLNEFQKLEDAALNGSKFVIMYQEGEM